MPGIVGPQHLTTTGFEGYISPSPESQRIDA